MKLLKNFSLKDNTRKLSKTDWIIMGVLVLIYGIISFIRLGDTSVPLTYKTFTYEGEEAVIELKEKTEIGKIRYYTGSNLGEFTLYTSDDGVKYNEEAVLELGSVFSWQDFNMFATTKYIKFVCNREGSTLGEVALYGNNNTILPMVIEEGNPLTDEIDLVPDELSFMNSTYFDEIYYARTVYEYINGIDVYEWSHPPLGKLIMAIPVLLFGFSPFNYRLMGNLFGILLIPLMYILAKRIFKNRKWALLAGLIMMFDTFHFAHTRIALVDGFQVAFILLSVLFMKEYMDLGKKDEFKKKALYLALSGLFIGCAITTKWNALYVGLGLAITFFVHLLKQYNVNIIKYLKKKITMNWALKWLTLLTLVPLGIYYLSVIIFGKEAATIITAVYYFTMACYLFVLFFNFIIKDKYLNNLMFVCIGSFIVLPIVIYVLSYVLFPNVSYYDGTLKGVIDIGKMMYEYHSGLNATHPFSSVWYQWPIMYKPVWLYSGGTSSGLLMTISDFGNPSIWWCGIVAFIYLVINSIKKKDSVCIFLLIFILSTYIPYIFVGRLMFMYHYFITLPFVMLGIVALIKWITEKAKNDRAYYGYIILIIFTFIIFYPIVSGMPISRNYIESLKWLSTWYF